VQKNFELLKLKTQKFQRIMGWLVLGKLFQGSERIIKQRNLLQIMVSVKRLARKVARETNKIKLLTIDTDVRLKRIISLIEADIDDFLAAIGGLNTFSKQNLKATKALKSLDNLKESVEGLLIFDMNNVTHLRELANYAAKVSQALAQYFEKLNSGAFNDKKTALAEFKKITDGLLAQAQVSLKRQEEMAAFLAQW
jgi:hypothetical protein